jgi:hypothetical protein
LLVVKLPQRPFYAYAMEEELRVIAFAAPGLSALNAVKLLVPNNWMGNFHSKD